MKQEQARKGKQAWHNFFFCFLFLFSASFLTGCGSRSSFSPQASCDLASGWARFDSQNYSAALACFDALAQRQDMDKSSRGEAYLGKGLSEFLLKKTEAAGNSFSQALNLVPTLSMAKVGKAETLLEEPTSANVIAAQTLLQDVIAKDPAFSFAHGQKSDISDVYALLSLTFLLQEDASHAFEAASIALQKDPRNTLAQQVLSALEETGLI